MERTCDHCGEPLSSDETVTVVMDNDVYFVHPKCADTLEEMCKEHVKVYERRWHRWVEEYNGCDIFLDVDAGEYLIEGAFESEYRFKVLADARTFCDLPEKEATDFLERHGKFIS